MDARTFLQKIIEEIPTRGLDNVSVYIHCQNPEDENEVMCFKIKEITNHGSNDSLSIILSPSEN